MPRGREVAALPRGLSRTLASYYNAPDHPAKLRIFSAVMKLFGNRRLTLRYAGSGWITVDLADLVARSILTTGAYEPEVWDALQPHLTQNAVVWDVGAHIGSFTVRALQDPRVQRVHVFEPDPALAALVRHHLVLNRGSATLHQFALLERDEMARFTVAPSANRGIGRVHEGERSIIASQRPVGSWPFNAESDSTLVVEGRSVDSVVYRDGVRPPTVMKIDVEDSEDAVLRGAVRTLREHPPRAIVVELPWDVAKRTLIDSESVEILRANRYRLEHIKRPAGYYETRENVLAVLEP